MVCSLAIYGLLFAWFLADAFGLRSNSLWQVIVTWGLVVPATLALCGTMSKWRKCYDRDKRIAKGQCTSCGYDLTGNTSGVCPECGTPVGRIVSN
jgi:hypothetical protein